ncbi:hypothetical protein [Streptomyces niveus]|uniref:hypothetical protein n=1 Tax=Streptomyces niveus TaxID=193462 RepID=UPI00386502B5
MADEQCACDGQTLLEVHSKEGCCDRRDRYAAAMAAANGAGPEWAYEWFLEADAVLPVVDEEQNGRTQRLLDEITRLREERDRYRLAWISARRRASREANFAAEALAGQDAELQRLRAFVEEVRDVRGWAMDGMSTYRTHLTPIYDALHELEEAQREGRPSRDRWTRVGPERMADMCPACHTMPSSVPQPAPCTCGDEPATVAYWRAELERVHQEKVRESTHGA